MQRSRIIPLNPIMQLNPSVRADPAAQLKSESAVETNHAARAAWTSHMPEVLEQIGHPRLRGLSSAQTRTRSKQIIEQHLIFIQDHLAK
jgi:hypothetical protein